MLSPFHHSEPHFSLYLLPCYIATPTNEAKLSPSPFDLSDFQGNVEIETYWLKGKRDKDGNAQAACPQFETQTISKAISKATISGPETVEDDEGLVKKRKKEVFKIYL